MRHRRIGRKLGVVSKHRRAMLRNMVTDLFRHEKIQTTDMKAKELRRFAEKVITLGKHGTLHAKRQAAGIILDKEILTKLFDTIAPRYKSRAGGYTRIIKLGIRRGDATAISHIELVEENFTPKTKRKPKPAKAAPEKPKADASDAAKSRKKEAAEELGLTGGE